MLHSACPPVDFENLEFGLHKRRLPSSGDASNAKRDYTKQVRHATNFVAAGCCCVRLSFVVVLLHSSKDT